MKLKNATFRIVCILAFVVLMLPLSIIAKAQETRLTTVVPNTHTLTIKISGNGIVLVDTEQHTQTTQIQISRHSNPTITVKAADGYQLKSVVFNGESITKQFVNDKWSMPGVISDVQLTVLFEQESSIPATGDVSNIYLWLILFMIALAGYFMCVLTCRRKSVYHKNL